MRTTLATVRQGQRTLGPWLTLALPLAWLLVLVRAVPSPGWPDRGIFVSVAERLDAGDRLYVDVWDNKDPLFYLTLAAGRLVSPYVDIVIELGWLVSASIAALVIATWLGLGRRWSVSVAFVAVPIILTGPLNYPGHTHLPGLALALVCLAFAVRGQWLWSGLVVGVLVFFKLVFVPLVIALLLVLLAVTRGGRRLAGLLIGALAAVTLVSGLLFVRDELAAYVQSLLLNLGYAGSVGVSRWGPIITHLTRVVSPMLVTVTLSVLFILGAIWARKGKAERDLRKPQGIVWLWAGISLVLGYVVLGLTGMWPQHGQILYLASVLSLLALISGTHQAIQGRSFAAVGALACLAFLLGGPDPTPYVHSAVGFPDALISATRVPPETAALASVAEVGSYARVGLNHDQGHAFGLRNWDLACPRFHQYPFESAEILRQTTDCLPKADAIIVSPSIFEEYGPQAWKGFLADVRDVLDRGYDCVDRSDISICTRR